MIESLAFSFCIITIEIYFIRDREALLTDIEMMAEAKEVQHAQHVI